MVDDASTTPVLASGIGTTHMWAMHEAFVVSGDQQSTSARHWNWQEPWRQIRPASPQSELRTHAGLVPASTVVPPSATTALASVSGAWSTQTWAMHVAFSVAGDQQSMLARHWN